MNDNLVPAQWDYRTLRVCEGLVRSIADNGKPLMLVPGEPFLATLARIKQEGWEMTMTVDGPETGVTYSFRRLKSGVRKPSLEGELIRQGEHD